MTLRALIADDEKMARKRLRRLLEALEVRVVAECVDGHEALQQLDAAEVDVALLDIQMPGLTGLDVSKLAAGNVPIIFTTAHQEHAVQAFDTGAADYVLKPIDPARLKLALGRVRTLLSDRSGETTDARLALNVRGQVRLVAVADISHALFDGELVTVWVSGEALLTERSLADLERRLPKSFVRVHRRALLNLERVERLQPLDSGGYLAITDNGHEVPVSRQSARSLRRQLGIT